MTVEAPRILVVDDEEEQIKFLREYLRDYDISVEGLTDPMKVLDHLRTTNDYALIIVDVNLGARKDGVDLGQDIRRHIGRKPILFVSAGISSKTRTKIRRFGLEGGIDFLEKGSFNPEQLFNTCVNLIKETAYTANIDEVKGNIRTLRDDFVGVSKGISNIFVELRSRPNSVIPSECEEKHRELIGKVVGIAIGETKKKMEVAFTPEILEPKVEAAMNPATVFDKAKAAPAAKAYKWAVGVIFIGLLTWWGVTWTKAEHADDRTRLLEEKHKQIMNSMQIQTTQMQQIRVILSNTNGSLTTGT